MAVYWVDPYRAINSAYACHGTTGDYATRDGSYANPFGVPDFYGYDSSATGKIGGTALSSGDEIRIKGEPLNHIWLAAQDVTYNTATKLETTSALPSGFGTSGTVKWGCALFEPYSTSNSSKNYDHYNTSRPYVHPDLQITVNASSGTLASKTTEHDPYFEAITRSLYSSIGSTLTCEMRLLDPAFADAPTDIPLATTPGLSSYMCGKTSSTTSLRVTDGWSSSTTQSSTHYSFMFFRPDRTATSNFYNHVAMDAMNTYFIIIDPVNTYTVSSINLSVWYEYGPGNLWFLSNGSDSYRIGGIVGTRALLLYGQNTTSITQQRPQLEEYGQILSRNNIAFENTGGGYQGVQGNNFDRYFHNISTTTVNFRAATLNPWPNSYTGEGKVYFGERYVDGYFYTYDGANWKDGWSINFLDNGAVYHTLSRPLWTVASGVMPTNVNFGSSVYNGEILPYDQSDGVRSLSAYPNHVVSLQSGYGAASGILMNLNPTNWYETILYSGPTTVSTSAFNWIGEIQVPSNTTLENFVPTISGTRAESYQYIGKQRMSVHTTNIPGDDRVVWFPPPLNSTSKGLVIAYLNSDGDIEVRLVPSSNGVYPLGFSMTFYVPIPEYWDYSTSAVVNPGSIPVMIKSFHGSGAYYASGSVMLGSWTTGQGWAGGQGGNFSINSTTYNSTSWTKRSSSYSSSNLQTRLPGPFTTPPTAPIDHALMYISLSSKTGDNFVSGMKYLFRVVTPDEWGDY